MSYKQLTQEQRYYISQEYRNQTQAEIARKIGCSKSTVSRELKQHSINGDYRYPYAQQQSKARRYKAKPADTVSHTQLPGKSGRLLSSF